MTAPIQKIFAVAIGVLIVLFLLFDGAGMTAATVNGDMAVTQALSENAWLWVVPSFMIFGVGFLLAWVVLGKEIPKFNSKPRRGNARSREADAGV